MKIGLLIESGISHLNVEAPPRSASLQMSGKAVGFLSSQVLLRVATLAG